MKTNKSQNGFIVGSLLVIMLVVSVLIVTVMNTTISNFQSATKDQLRVNAQFAADAGLDVGIHELNLDENWVGTWDGTDSEIDFYTTTSGKSIRTTYDVEISPGSATNRRTITSTARVYSPDTDTTPKVTRIYQLEAEAVTTGTGPSSVVTGVGGLSLINNARIAGGDVVVNGSLNIENGAQIGLSTNAVNLRVAHQSCPSPVDATYPQVCTSGEPIVNNGLIYADVQAQNQVTTTGMSNPGLVIIPPNTTSKFDPIVVPGYDRTAHKAAVITNYPSNDSTVACGNNQTKTWPSESKISGNIALGNNCTVNVSGRVWITGNLTFGNGAKIVVSNSAGATRPVIMIDGSSGVIFGNNSQVTPNNVSTGVELITTWWNTNTATNGNFNCGGISDLLDCTSVTGLALSTSQAITTINFANGSTAPNSVLRSLWTRLRVANNGAIGAVSGQTILLDNNAVINFTASIPGSDNLVVTWVKRGYLRVFQ